MFGPNPTACMNYEYEEKRTSNFTSDPRNVALVAAVAVAAIASILAAVIALAK